MQNTNPDREELKKILINIGASEEEADEAITEVQGIIIDRFLAEYIPNLPESDQKALQQLHDEAGIKAYIDSHKDRLPVVSMDRFNEIATATWKDYFQDMQS
jgi:hypothetical protein